MKNDSSSLHYYNCFCPKMILWYNEALKELNLKPKKKKFINTDYCIFPKRFYGYCSSLSNDKKYKYTFIGSLKVDHLTSINRSWIIDFINNKFNNDCYLQFTDKKTKENYVEKGLFDFTLKTNGFVPKEVKKNKRNYLDTNYYKKINQSQFTLCPAGDSFYSMRFLEAIMCHSIPIVLSYDETFRSKKESLLGYKYYLASEEHIFRQDWIDENYRIFINNHTFKNNKINNMQNDGDYNKIMNKNKNNKKKINNKKNNKKKNIIRKKNIIKKHKSSRVIKKSIKANDTNINNDELVESEIILHNIAKKINKINNIITKKPKRKNKKSNMFKLIRKTNNIRMNIIRKNNRKK